MAASRLSDRSLKVRSMDLKTVRLTVLIDPEKRLALEQVCTEPDLTPSLVGRRLIRDDVARHGAKTQRGPAERTLGPA